MSSNANVMGIVVFISGTTLKAADSLVSPMDQEVHA
jgi:hypothetical protein